MTALSQQRKKQLCGALVGFLAFIGLPLCSHAEGVPAHAHLKVALLPILDVLPYYVAEEEGFFEAAGVKAQAVPVASGLERDQLMQSGEIDGMLTEMTTTAAFNRAGARVKIVRVARKAYPDYPLFRLLAAPNSGLRTPRHLAGVPIGVSMNTIIEYVTDRLLAAQGLGPDEIVKRSVPAIPERYQLLMQGQLKAATLPDPLAVSALKAGAVPVVDDASAPFYGTSVLSFSAEAMEKKPQAVRRFLSAWDRGAAEINDRPDRYLPLLRKKIRVPPNVQEAYRMPPYPRNEVPSEAQWEDIMAWMLQKGLLGRSLPYHGSVTEAFLR